MLCLRIYSQAVFASSEFIHTLAILDSRTGQVQLRLDTSAHDASVSTYNLFELPDRRLLDTPAAAFAEAGKFKEAVAWQEVAVRNAPFELEDGYKARL